MGTRYLTIVQKDNEIKVAQYGQWDGYPSGNGITVLKFCKNAENLEKLKKKLDYVSFWVPEDEDSIDNIDTISKRITGYYDSNEYLNKFLSRDVGANILSNLINDVGYVKLNNSYDYAYSSAFWCEFAYLINFDTNELEVYFDCPISYLRKDERFYRKELRHKDYYSLMLMEKYNLNDLPSEEQFIKDLEGDE